MKPRTLASLLLLATSLAQAQTPFSFAPPAPAASPGKAGTTQPLPFLLPETFPDGRVTLKRKSDPLAPLEITVPADGQRHFVKLVDVKTGKDTVLLYLSNGVTKRTKVPLGTYELRYASGTTWFGEKGLFGPGTQRFKAQTQLAFRVERDGVAGHSIRLIKQRDGNLGTKLIDESEF